MEIKTILISQFPLPYHKIGSWTTMYKQYLEQNHSIDFIICPPVTSKFSNITYSFFERSNNLVDKLSVKFGIKNKWHKELAALQNILDKNSQTRFVIQIIDNVGLQMAVQNLINKRGLKSRVYLQFFYHGFMPFKQEKIYTSINELILLTHKSYTKHLKDVNELPCKVSILHNGIDTSRFKKPETQLKLNLRKNFEVTNQKVFIWCSQDRPKKGLHIILEAWKRVYNENKNMQLWVIGTHDKKEIDGVQFLGRIANQDLIKYYQAADVYLFPTLCQEGFGLSLIEALHCGCYCIASNLGGVPEVLNNGKYGKLIEHPHMVDSWIQAIQDALVSTPHIEVPSSIYSSTQWNQSMNKIINNAKYNLT